MEPSLSSTKMLLHAATKKRDMYVPKSHEASPFMASQLIPDKLKEIVAKWKDQLTPKKMNDFVLGTVIPMTKKQLWTRY